MALAASASRIGRTDAPSNIEASAFARVQPVCNFVNAEVARLRHQTVAIGVVCAIGAVLLPAITGIGDPRIPFVLTTGIFAFCFARARAELAWSYTNLAAKRIVAALSKELSYKSASSLTHQQFIAMDLFGAHEQWKSQSEIGGRARGVKYSLHQVHAAGKSRTSAVFDGVIIKIDCNDSFPGHTVILPDRAGQMPGENANAGSRVKRDLVLLKNPAFERRFSVFATDYYEARRVVTPYLMTLVMEGAATFRTDLRLAFAGKSLFVAVAGEAFRVEATLFGAPLTPQTAVGKMMHLVAFAQRLAQAVAE